jgi:hypothetical protein
MALIQAYGESIHEHILYGKKTMLGVHTQRHIHKHTQHKKKIQQTATTQTATKVHMQQMERQQQQMQQKLNQKKIIKNNATPPDTKKAYKHTQRETHTKTTNTHLMKLRIRLTVCSHKKKQAYKI